MQINISQKAGLALVGLASIATAFFFGALMPTPDHSPTFDQVLFGVMAGLLILGGITALVVATIWYFSEEE